MAVSLFQVKWEFSFFAQTFKILNLKTSKQREWKPKTESKLKQINLTAFQLNIITTLKVEKGRRKSGWKKTNPSNLYLTIYFQSWVGLGEEDLQNDPEFFYYGWAF